MSASSAPNLPSSPAVPPDGPCSVAKELLEALAFSGTSENKLVSKTYSIYDKFC